VEGFPGWLLGDGGDLGGDSDIWEGVYGKSVRELEEEFEGGGR
jgi:hypothetical protein